MALGGLWHGANWTFLLWGVLHGAGVALVHWFRRAFRWLPRQPDGAEPKDPGAFRIPWVVGLVVTFHYVTALWVFFRAPSIGEATEMLAAPFVGSWSGASEFCVAHMFILVLIALALLLHRFDDHRRIKAAVRYVRPEVLWPAIVLLWIVAITVSQATSAKFIYFDF